MQRSMTKRRIVSSAPMAAITLRSPSKAEDMPRAGTWLVIYMRCIAVVWLGEGLLQWCDVLVSRADGHCALAVLPVPDVVAIVFFAVFDLVAAVGLWLVAPWGGVIWLVAAGAQFFVLLAMPGFYDYPIAMGSIGMGLVIGYLALTWLVARSQDRRT